MLTACGQSSNVVTGSIQVVSTPTAAEVYLEGTLRGQTPLVIRELSPGEYTVRLAKPGYADAVGRAIVHPRRTSYVQGLLEQKPTLLEHHLAYLSNKDGSYEIWTIKEDGTGQRRWTAFNWEQPATAMAAIPGKGYLAVSQGQLAYETRTWVVAAPDPQEEILGFQPVQVGGDTIRLVQWSADGTLLLLENLASQTLWLVNANGSGMRLVPIPDIPRGVTGATLSPHGQQIAYSSYDRTWLMDVDTASRQELALNGPAGNSFLRWSPDGLRIAYVKVMVDNVYRAGELWVMNANGSVPKRISLGNSQDFDPVWSPDSSRLAFVHRENVGDATADQDPSRLVSNLWVFDIKAESLRSVTAFQGQRVWQPSWSPDGRLLAFVCDDSGRDEVWLVNVEEGRVWQLTRDESEAAFPVWLW
ncbi:MAG: PEGA domain-containing protein [Anaerolineae bacterium]